MRPRTLLLGAAVAALTASCASGGQAADPDHGTDWNVPCEQQTTEATAADFEEFTLDCLSGGDEYALGDLSGRPRVITLWASWCGPCREEAPAFRKFHERLGDRIDVVGVDTQDDPGKGRAFAADAEWRFPSVVDDEGAVMRSAGITALPVTFFVAADGETVATYNEGELTVEKLEQAATEHFGVTP